MAMPRKSVRGLRNIRTSAARLDRSSPAYKVHIRIGCLEMERQRLESERAQLANRMEAIDERVRDIEREIASLQGGTVDLSGAQPAAEPDADAAPKESGGGFRIRY